LDVPSPDERDARDVLVQLTLSEFTEHRYPATDHVLFHRSIGEARLPSTLEMAAAAEDITAGRGVSVADPDAYLHAALEAETDLYFAIEEAVQRVRLDSLLARGPGLTDVIDFAMSIQQSRRSRRGQSLQNHFAAILRAERLRFSEQCATERGETPDFIFPGCVEYHDPEYPDESLRMVACKTTAKERWRQVLHEAERIPEKYLVTVDPGLSRATVEAMQRAGVVVFLPRPSIDTAYGGTLAQQFLTIRDLVDRLRVASPESASA
jgi:hypothetical protein